MRLKKISIKKFLIDAFVIQFVHVLFSFTSSNTAFISFLTILQLGFGIYSIQRNKKSVITFESLFLIASYLFHMGNIISVLFGGAESNFILGEDERLINSSIRIVMATHMFFVLGVISVRRLNDRSKNLNFFCSEKMLFLCGSITTLVGLFPRLFLDIIVLKMRIGGNYLDTYEINKQGIGGLAMLFYVGVEIMLYASSNNKHRARLIIAICFCWQFVMMFSGHRYSSLSFLLVLSYIYFKRIEYIRPGKVLLVLIATYFLSALLATISDSRNTAFSLVSFLNIYIDTLKENPLIELFLEMGGSMISVIYSLRHFPIVHDFALGKTYVESIFSLIPGLSNIADPNNLIYVYRFSYHEGFGGSWIGELYYNFSYAGCLFGYFIGLAIAKVDIILSKKDRSENYFSVLIVIPFLLDTISYIRGYFVGYTLAVKELIFVLALYFISVSFIMHKNNGK